jgi:tetratricopeptide (TPR) repeat protein
MFVQSGTQSLQHATARGQATSAKVGNLLGIVSNVGTSTGAKYLAAGKLDEIEGSLGPAIECYERALIEDSTLHEARARIALACLKAGAADRAEDAVVALLSFNKNFVFQSLVMGRDMSALTVLGEVKFTQGKTDEAVIAFRAALNLNSGDTLAMSRLGTIAITFGNATEAASAFGGLTAGGLSSTSLEYMRDLAVNDPDILPMIRTTDRDVVLMAEQVPFMCQ